MPTKKTDLREIQKKIENNAVREVAHHACCNGLMQCDRCGREQRIRTVCCFCNTINEAPLCTVCGKQKRLVKNGDCINKHTGKCVIDQKSVLNEKHSTVENALKHFAKS
ncbi:NOA36 family protein [Acanthocheilonema viteae]